MNIGLFKNGTLGAQDGTLVDNLNPLEDGDFISGQDALGQAIPVAVRLLSASYDRPGVFPIILQGVTATKWRLAPDNGSGTNPGTYEDWGDQLELPGPLTDDNSIFWLQPRVTIDEEVEVQTEDTSVKLVIPDDVVSGGVGRSWSLPYGVGGVAGRSWSLPYVNAGALSAVGRSWDLSYAVSDSWAFDNFTDAASTAVTAHTSDSSHTWASHPTNASNQAIISNSNRVRLQAVSGYFKYLLSATPADADYTVKGYTRTTTIPASFHSLAVLGRAHSTDETFYYAAITQTLSGPATTVALWKVIAGAFTQLGSTVSLTNFADNSDHTIELEMIGNAIKVYVDGTQRISVTDSGITAAGKGGFFLQQGNGDAANGVGLHLDKIELNG